MNTSTYPTQPPFLMMRKKVSLPDRIVLDETSITAEKVHDGLVRSRRRLDVYWVSTDVRIFNNEIQTHRYKFSINIKFSSHMISAVVGIQNYQAARCRQERPYLLDDSRVGGTTLDQLNTRMIKGAGLFRQFDIDAYDDGAWISPYGVKKGGKIENRATLSNACLKDKGRFQAINKLLVELHIQGTLQDGIAKERVSCPGILRVIPEDVKGVDYQSLYERTSQEPPQFFVQGFVHRADFTPCLKKSKEIGGVLPRFGRRARFAGVDVQLVGGARQRTRRRGTWTWE